MATADPYDQESWVDLLSNRFRIEVVQERQLALFKALAAYAGSLNETPESLYRKAVRHQLSRACWAEILHLATNHETSFFRSLPVLEMLGRLAAGFSCPRILCVGCSTGEEPYSIAVHLSQNGQPNFHIHGTDISERCIEKAHLGVYPTHPAVSTQFAGRSEQPQGMRFFEWVKDVVTFEVHNVLSSSPMEFQKPDIILTQNMLIYYRFKSRRQILDSLSCLLAPGGYLITAAAEEAHWNSSEFERIAVQPATVFRKTP